MKNHRFIQTAENPTSGKIWKNIRILVFATITLLLFSGISSVNSFAESKVTPINDEYSLETVTVSMNIPEDNTLPWGKVAGTIKDPSEGYPVIIQFFSEENDNIPIHVAQVDVKEDNTYEYKFRVRDVNLETGKITNIFEGYYTVKIFRVIHTPQESLDAI